MKRLFTIRRRRFKFLQRLQFTSTTIVFLLKLATVLIFEIDSDAIFAPAAIANFSLSADLARYLPEKIHILNEKNQKKELFSFIKSENSPSLEENSNQ